MTLPTPETTPAGPPKQAPTKAPFLGAWVQSLTRFIVHSTRRASASQGVKVSALATPLALIICLALLLRQVTPGTMADVTSALAGFSAWQWALSIIFTGLSYLAIGRNEAVAHDLLQTTVPHKRARRAGMQAVALAQALGFGTLIAAFVRRRTLPELGLWPLARLSVVASLTFLAALATLAVLALIFTRTGSSFALLSACGVGFVLMRRLAPLPTLPGLTRGRALRAMTWTALDTGLAACALFVFLPAQPDLAPMTVICAYLLALGAGLMSQSPGGLGALELTLILLLPQVPTGQLLAALFAYRLTYHALPAGLAMATLMRKTAPAQPPALIPLTGKSALRALHRAGQADWGLFHQGAHILTARDQSNGWLTRQTATSLVAIGRPLGQPVLAALTQAALATGHTPLLYKCDARLAATARKQGWAVMAIAQEATIVPAAWSADGSDKRQLRRKLRDATKAGLRIDARPGRLPWDQMRAVHNNWCALRGPERGFSMGRFSHDLITRQITILAYCGDRLVGFITLHKTPTEWGLDLVRFCADAPSGTMQSLLTAAIALARERRIPVLSLAACLHPNITGRRLFSGQDSRQFKHSFAPNWHSLYAAAPTPSALLTGLATTAQAIHYPAPLPKPLSERRRWTRGPKFRFDLSRPKDYAQDLEYQSASAPTAGSLDPARSRQNDQRPDKTPD